jgi:hypothetical protein
MLVPTDVQRKGPIWAEYHETVAEVLVPPSNLVLACGMSIGYADPEVPRPRMPRARLADAVTFTP